MKALICWLLLNLVSLVFAAEELPWTPVEVPGLEIAVSAAQHGGPWFHGDFGWLNAGQEIWITHDAGRSWTLSLTVPDSRNAFYDAYFLNAQEGWVAFGLVPHLFHTSDGGQTWQPVEVEVIQSSDPPVPPNILFLSRIYFKDSLHGLGTFTIDTFPQRSGSIVVRTEDGGQCWTEIGRSVPFPQLIGIGEHVWIDSDYSPDFGETFQRISRLNMLDISFVSPSYGWGLESPLLENQQRRWDVFVTFDAGHTWSDPIFSRIAGSGGSSIHNLCLMSEEIGGFLWYPSRGEGLPLLYMTYNGGLSWFSYDVPFERGTGVILGSPYRMSCNRQRREVWLFPIAESEEVTLFYASIDPVTAVQPSSKLLSTWGALKKIEKE